MPKKDKILSEKDKMLASLPYNARDKELMLLHKRARELMAQYNLQYIPNPEDKTAILKQLFAYLGSGVWIEPPFFCDYGCHISIGANSFVNFNCVFLDCNYINIGRNVLIAPSVQIYAVTHPVKVEDRIRKEFRTTQNSSAPATSPATSPAELPKDLAVCADITAPVNIGDNAWIGGGSIILPGVSIGEGTSIGAGSLVTKDIPAGVLAYGSPCRVIKKLV